MTRFILARAEPTPEMDAAASKAPYQKLSRPNDPPAPLWVWLADSDFDVTLIRTGYRAMLQASPALTPAEVDEACIKWDGCLGGQSYHWQRDKRGRWIVPPLDEDSTEWPRRREFDRARMLAFIATLSSLEQP